MKPKNCIETRDGSRRGFAVLSVLFVLIALLVLCAPFLMTARSANRHSTQLSDEVQKRLGLDSGVKHARAQLGFSHPATDATPYFDDAEELSVQTTLDPKFWDNHDPRSVMWDVEASDVAGRIDVGSAPPQMFANLVGGVTRLSEALKAKDKVLKVMSTSGFEAEGYLWVGSELVRYTAQGDGEFSGLTRGLTANVDKDGNWTGCGPSPALDQPLNTAVIDQRAFAIPLWRIANAAKGLRTFDAIEQVRDAAPLALSGFGADLVTELDRRTSVYGGVRGGPLWQRAVRITNSLRSNQDCVVRVSERRNFNPGTTVMISDGRTIEFGMVIDIPDSDGLRLANPVRMEYLGYRATIAPLARRPVNINVAPLEVLHALFLNLQLRQHSNRVTRDEAAKLAALVIESRPFTGHEDFLRRIVLPAAGVELLAQNAPVKPALLAPGSAPVIDVDDAIAVYANALNANDERLAYSTMPFSFVSRDVYSIHARAAVNAPSGAQRSMGVREEVALIVPQEDLMTMWARQDDFEEALRLTSDAPYWCTGPNATSRFDGPSVPPSRLFAHWGTWKDQPFVPGRTAVSADEVPNPQHVFGSRDDTAWSQLMPARVEENTSTKDRMLHFDNETRDLEGRYLPDEAISYVPEDKKLQWAPAAGGLAKGLTTSGWIKPRVTGDGTFLDFGTGALDTDRIWLGIEGPDLVLRVIDGPGDHPLSALRERGEARFAIAPGTGPGLAADTWSHVDIDVRGNRPDQISLAIDGRTFGVRTPGMSRLSSTFGAGSIVFTLESGEGFPDRGVVRIGNELVEYVRNTPTSFVSKFEATGPHAGFGGRLSRNAFTLTTTGGIEPGTNSATGVVNENHAPSTPVELYGYSRPIASNVPSGEGALAEAIGRFAVGYVVGVEKSGGNFPGEPISVSALPTPLGLGMEGVNSQVSGLKLFPADPSPMTTPLMMSAFQKTGGYALVMQLAFLTFNGEQAPVTLTNSPLFGSEVIHYTGWTNDVLFINQRAALPSEDNDTRPHAFIVDWQVTLNGGEEPDLYLDRKMFVLPISVNAGANAINFLPPQPTLGSEFAQITELGAAELTEWVRYDRILQGQLVRCDPVALKHCRERVIGAPRGNGDPPQGPGGPTPGPSISPPQSGGGGAINGFFLSPSPPAAQPAPPQTPYAPSMWSAYLGTDEDINCPVTRTARTALQFRGVLGTYPHAHQAGTKVHPVWRVYDGDANSGQPGHGDYAFLIDALPSDPGFPLQVHRAYRPRQYMEWSWIASPSAPLIATNGPAVNPAPPESGFPTNFIYVAANAAMQAPTAAGTSQTNVSAAESRLLARLTLFPSGERPRDANRVEIGRALDGSGVPSAVIDEIAFGAPHFGEGTQHAEALQGAQMVLIQSFGVGAAATEVFPQMVRVARGLVADPKTFLSDLPKDAGLLRIGSEIVCYDNVDATNGQITIASGGRGLLGTTEEAHEIGEPVTFLESRVVTTLSGGISAGSSILEIEDAAEFPFQGTVLIGDELIHYTHLTGNQLLMPRGSSVPGAMDENGNGLFRGRFGTLAAGHGAAEPVILFPFRYWDRWADRADAPELGYFGLSIDQPNAFWRGVFFQADEPPGTKIEVLQRSNPLMPWDAEPEVGLGQDLAVIQEGLKDGASRTIGVQRDGLEWRVYVRYAPNAFDAAQGLSHGWKRTPRLTRFGVEYLGPSLTLRRVDE